MATVEGPEKLELKLRKLSHNIDKALILSGERLVMRAVAIQESYAPGTVATGQTIRSHMATPVRTGVDAEGVYKYIKMGPRTKYAKWGIGTGRAPGLPPPLWKIHAWVVEKPGGPAANDPMGWAIARVVQRKIATEGTRAYNVLEIAMQVERSAIGRLYRAAIRDALAG